MTTRINPRTRIANVSALSVTAGMIAIAALVAPAARADTLNDRFLTALSDAGIAYGDPASAVELGKSLCPMLIGPGKSVASTYATVTNNGIPPDVAAFFAGIAISMYCPSMMASIGNGTLLNWLQAPHP